MKEIVEWLIHIEDWARRAYGDAAHALKADEPVFALLSKMAADEAMHFYFMKRVLVWLNQNPDVVSDILLDKNTIENAERPLKEIENSVKSGEVNSEGVIQSVLKAEHSDWNHIFLYVMNTLKRHYPDFKPAGPSIQHHIRTIERFHEKFPDKFGSRGAPKTFPRVWDEKILIVDDSELILSLLKAVLSKVGIVDTAENGQEAFRKTSEDYYAVIISDIDMPVMDGIEFYKKLHNLYPHIQKRFILMSGAPTPDVLAFIRNEKLTFLNKPFTIQDVRKNVFSIMDQIMP